MRKEKKILNEIIAKYNKKYIFLLTEYDTPSAFPEYKVIILNKSMRDSPNDSYIFSVLHEIGHCETYKKTQTPATKEFLATKWAIKEFSKLGIKFKKTYMEQWQDYINSFVDKKDLNKYKLNWSLLY